MTSENSLIFDPRVVAEPFFFHGSRQNCRDMHKKQNKELEFGFDRVFGCDSSNEAVFEGSTKDMVKSLLDGYNCSGEYNSTCVSFCSILITLVSVSKDYIYLQNVINPFSAIWPVHQPSLPLHVVPSADPLDTVFTCM